MTYKRGKKAEKKPRPAICEEIRAVTVQRREALQPSWEILHGICCKTRNCARSKRRKTVAF